MWTRQVPKKDGYYWIRRQGRPLQVDYIDDVYRSLNSLLDDGEMVYWWDVPIKPPYVPQLEPASFGDKVEVKLSNGQWLPALYLRGQPAEDAASVGEFIVFGRDMMVHTVASPDDIRKADW